jgi:hypothetical protein
MAKRKVESQIANLILDHLNKIITLISWCAGGVQHTVGKSLNKGYNFVLDLTLIGGLKIIKEKRCLNFCFFIKNKFLPHTKKSKTRNCDFILFLMKMHIMCMLFHICVCYVSIINLNEN